MSNPLLFRWGVFVPNCENQRRSSSVHRLSDMDKTFCGSVYVPPHNRHIRTIVPSYNRLCSTTVMPEGQNVPVSEQHSENGLVLMNMSDNRINQLQKEHHQNSSTCALVTKDLSNGNSQDYNQPLLPVSTLASDNIEEWKCKLHMLLLNEEKREVISREKKDRHNFELISSLAMKMGLYSMTYAKVVVISKDPLPNYRFDLDDKRPQREVFLSPALEKEAMTHLKSYISESSKSIKPDHGAPILQSTSVSGIASEEGLFELPELASSGECLLENILHWRSVHLCNQQRAWQDSAEGKRMLEFRRTLPVYKEKNILLTSISQAQVTIISGETGCGKTTQIPQFILESEIDSLRGSVCNIICTQPRRISVISVSERVAAERGEKLGESVGYKIRLEGLKGKETHLLFCTTGILLRRLLSDRNLKGVSHIIVDEIHERAVNEDFLLIVLKDLLLQRPELRLILMSATLDTELFSSYFGGSPVIRIPGYTFPVRSYFLEDILEFTGYQLTPLNQTDDHGFERTWKGNRQGQAKRKSKILSFVEETLKPTDFLPYSLSTRQSLYNWNPDIIGFNLIENLLCVIHQSGRAGAILVFLTGWEDINSLKEKLQAHPVLGDQSRVLLLACHGSMASSEQRLIFQVEENGVRKIVLATNIAETSITINDVVFVVDCGKAKETSYDAVNNTPCLLPSWISKVSAKQRRGRAGRVQAGECYHLYPKCLYDAFPDSQLPEILRTPLQSLCLQIKSLKLGTISQLLSRALQSPDLLAVQKAIDLLKVIGALDEDENLTVLGRYLTTLPVEPKLGKMLVFGSIFRCLDPILTIVAGLSVRDPFLMPLDKRDLAEESKGRFSGGQQSDHVAIVRAYEAWKVAEMKGRGLQYCWDNFLSHNSMKTIDGLRKEFLSSLRHTGLVTHVIEDSNTCSTHLHFIRAVICSGLYPGVCVSIKTEKSATMKTMDDGLVFLSSNSVSSKDPRIPYPWLLFNEKVKVNSVFLRDATAVSDSVLLLFGGTISPGDHSGHLKMLDGFLEFFMHPSLAQMYCTLRAELERLIQNKIVDVGMDMEEAHGELLSAVRVLISGDECAGRFVFHRQAVAVPPASRTESGPGGDNSKSQLQTLLVRAGRDAPVYRTKQLKNNQFRGSVEFGGMQFTGQPCHNKKAAEKDAATEALQFLVAGRGDAPSGAPSTAILKRIKKDH